ncbi:hypothetical protein LTR12_008151 [Friedmanniomyces endolithicus]|nr:hypothetical protein LTR74_015250 [Friedmanniomyces endolithicus]KAK1817395.1 hypothetical protein LTR12_008151 [Friedmanniomyces endolithicus]
MGIFDKKHGGEKVDEAADLPAYERDHSLDVEDGLFENADQLRRRLGNRQIQLIAIGGSIGTALFGKYLTTFLEIQHIGLIVRQYVPLSSKKLPKITGLPSPADGAPETPTALCSAIVA